LRDTEPGGALPRATSRRDVLTGAAVGASAVATGISSLLLPSATAAASLGETQGGGGATTAAAAGDSGLRVVWAEMPGVTTTVVEWRASGTSDAYVATGVVVDAAARTATITGLTNGVAYDVRVTGTAGDGLGSVALTAATPERVMAGGTAGGSGAAAYRTHTFTATPTGGTVSVASLRTFEVLVVGGGGGGGGSYDTGSSGGGGGGEVVQTSVAVAAGTVAVTVGAGGARGIGNRNLVPAEQPGGAGGSSVFAGATAVGGRGGAASRSGGEPGLRIGGTASVDGVYVGQGGGGGGNATAGIGSGAGAGHGGNGGNGASSGVAAGGAGTTATLTGATYGAGGAGNRPNAEADGADAPANTGRGGQGSGSKSSDDRDGGAGGSGLVVVRYPLLPAADQVAAQIA